MSNENPSVEWRWWLCDSANMEQLAELTVYSKQMQPQLNSPGKVTGWAHLLDENSGLILPHQTCIRTDRNNVPVWSGPIFQTNEQTAAQSGNQSGQDQNAFTAMGWFQILNQRDIHTGKEFQAMLNGPNGQAWQEANGAYVERAVDQATTLAYSATNDPTITDAVIIFDLLNRANIDSPTGITPGKIYGTPVQRNLTLNQFQSVGAQILQLVNTEAGCDFVIDPVTRQMHLYGPGASNTPDISNGYGVDRGTQTLFSLPGNCVAASRTRDGTQTANRVIATGPYGVGRADDLSSQTINGLFEVTDSLSDVTDPNILIAYANAEVTVRAQPWTIVTFTPRGLNQDDSNQPVAGVPRPYVDYEIGDIVYAAIERGSFVVGSPENPQAVRMFGWTLTIDDDTSTEKLTSIQTAYSSTSS